MIAFFKPWLGQEEQVALRAPLERHWLVQGPEVEAFETEFADYVGAAHAVAVSSGTAALHLMLLALGVGPGDEVVAPTHSFIATSNAIRMTGARVVFVDIEPRTLNLDPAAVERALTPRTRAVMGVHQFGMPCDLEALARICENAGVTLLEDAACAIGSEVRRGGRWEKIGKPHGKAAAFSFHPRKLLTTGEGGMVVSGDLEFARRVRRLRQHGLEGGDFVELGYNFRMSDLLAAVGRVQLARLPRLLERRRVQVRRYREALGDAFQHQPEWARSNRQTLALHLQTTAKRVAALGQARGIGFGTGIVNSHQTPAYPRGSWSCGPEVCDCAGPSCARLAHSEHATDHTLLLPLYHDLSSVEQEQVIRLVEEALSSSPS